MLWGGFGYLQRFNDLLILELFYCWGVLGGCVIIVFNCLFAELLELAGCGVVLYEGWYLIRFT